jgi:heptaprenyl diphosphate synthase
VNVVELLGLPALEEQLQLLEPMLTEVVVTGDDFLDEVTTHLIAAGGKRLRPVLSLATATGGTDSPTREDLLGAVAVELVHLASLYHDDVMDEATIRRNVESVNSRFGNLVAIVAGDFLLARSAEIAAGLGTEIAGLLAATLGELCRGQVSEVHAAFQVGRTLADYTDAISGKTASLMATSCRIGALTAGHPRSQVDAFTTFGRCFGMIFQVRDDILDVVGSATELGKPPGQDLAEGIYTLPVLLALADPVAGPELKPLLGQPLGDGERETARAIVAASGAVAASVAIGRRYAEEAAEAAGSCSSPALASGFATLAHSTVDELPTGSTV